MRAIILGCGPAGLMAAQGLQHECEAWGEPLDLRIISRKRPSDLFGAQYLHEPIPGATTGMPVTVQYRLTGTPEQYRRKVYGPLWDGTVSPEDLATPHRAWDIRDTYHNLWSIWEPAIEDARLDGASVPLLSAQMVPSADLFINSVPRDALCIKQHTFGYTEVVAAGDAPSLGILIGRQFQTTDNTVVCNGEESPSWYRKSRVFYHTTVEWPGNIGRVPVTTAARVRKPLWTDCDCWPEVRHVGRYGQWSKGVLSHTAYDDAQRWARESLRELADR